MNEKPISEFNQKKAAVSVEPETKGLSFPKNDKKNQVVGGKPPILEKSEEPLASYQPLIKNIIALVRKTGEIPYEEIANQLQNVDMTTEQIERFYLELENVLNMEAGLPTRGKELEPLEVPDEDFEKLEEPVIEIDLSIPDGVSLEDPVRMYSKKSVEWIY